LDAAAWAGQWIEFIVTVMIHVSRGLSQQGYVFAFDKVSIICIMASSMGLVLMCVSPLVRYRRGLILGIFVINLAGYAYLKQRQLVIALDVGQGDATLIINGFTSILVDTAGIKKNRSIALDRVIPSLRYYGIDRLTAVVLTHHDMDHSGGLDALVLFGIGRSYSNENIGLKNHTHVQKPHRLTYSNLSIDLYPAAAISDDVSANNQGLMVAVVLGNRRFLITGDMDEHTELLLLRHKLIFPVDFLKMGHHGSRYSTSTELLKVTNPRYVWNSAGKFNRYGHPHPFTLKRIENQGVPWGSTHRDGAIVFTIKKHHVRIHHLLSDRSIIIKNKGKSL
jgi:competence protein ComEC